MCAQRLTGALFGLACMAAVAMLPANAAGMQMAITFDDLPAHASLPPGVTRTDVAKSIIHALKAHHAPQVFGFVNAEDVAQTPADAEVLRLWRDAGFPLGNHTYSHPDANAVTAAVFERDILADEPTLRKYMARHDWHWLRLPFLQEGDTPEKRHEIAGFLESHKYRLAQVTLSFDDYAYNDPYARCMKKGDTHTVERMKQNYLDRASVDIVAAQKMSTLLYGRDIKHVLLMHIGAFDAVMLPELLKLYERRGVRFISLPAAESDPAYKDSGSQQFDWGGTMLAEQMVARNIPIPAFANRDDELQQIDSLCK